MSEMTEHEAILLDLLLQAIQVDPAHGDANPQIDALLRSVRATALRAAAKALIKEAETGITDIDNGTRIDANWLFDRADDIETGRV